jgi:hypothetical protein
VSLILYILIITWGTVVALWTFNRVVDDVYSDHYLGDSSGPLDI